MCTSGLQRPEGSIRSIRTRVPGSCEPPNPGVRSHVLVLFNNKHYSQLGHIQPLIRSYLLHVHGCLVCTFMRALLLCVVAMKTRRHWMPWKWSYEWLCATMWVLGTTHGRTAVLLTAEQLLQASLLQRWSFIVDCLE